MKGNLFFAIKCIFLFCHDFHSWKARFYTLSRGGEGIDICSPEGDENHIVALVYKCCFNE